MEKIKILFPKLGKRFVRIEEVRARNTEDSYINAIEITAEGGTPRSSRAHPFRRLPLTISTEAGAMPTAYTFEREA